MRACQHAVRAWWPFPVFIILAVLGVLSACATGRNDTAPAAENTVSDTHTVASISAPVPVRGAGRVNPARKPSPAVRPRQNAVQKPCMIKSDSVAWVHVSGPCRQGYAHGQGQAESADGQRHYSGGFVAGSFHGAGRYDWGNGILYTGQFVRGAKSGHGRIEYPDNRLYEGGFRDNLYHGTGRYTEADGSVYEGEFVAGRFHGRGVYVWANGDKYTGQFRDDLMEGDGVYLRANGEVYTGRFSRNERNGAGAYQWPGGDRYTGDFRDNEINGEGTYYHADGTKYVGSFQAGKKHGWGRLITAAGDFRQHWERGQKISEETGPPAAGTGAAPPAAGTAALANQ